MARIMKFNKNKVLFVVCGVMLFFAGGIISLILFHSVESIYTTRYDNKDTDSVIIEHVRVKKVSRQTIYRTLSVPGTVVPYQQAKLYGMVAGYLDEIRYDIGDFVKKDDLIAKIAVPELETELKRYAAELKRYKAALKRDQANHNLMNIIYKRLANIQGKNPDMVSVEQVDEARGKYEVAQAEVELAKAMIGIANSNYQRIKVLLSYSEIRAPYDCIITTRWVDPGALIQTATSSQKDASPIVHVMDIDTVRIQFYVPETDVPFIKIGNTIRLGSKELTGKVFEGRITRFARALKEETRSMLAEVEIPNKEHQLKAGMYTIVTVVLEEHHNAITVPAEVVVTELDKAYVYTVENGIVEKFPVQMGIDDGVQIEILDGLTGEEMVIVEGRGLVSEGDIVKSSM